MKKLAKILVLCLVVALLGGILAVAAFADEPTPTPWTPKDIAGTAINEATATCYGVWASYEDYLNGLDPIATNVYETLGGANNDTTNDGWDYLTGAVKKSANIIRFGLLDSYKSCYIRLFADVTAYFNDTDGGGKVTVLDIEGQNVTVDLGGHKLTRYAWQQVPFGYYSTGNSAAVTSYITFKDGTIDWTTDGQVQIQTGVTVSFEEVTLLGTTIGYNNGGNINFTDCDVTLNNKQPFSLGCVKGEHRINFVRTKLNLTSTEITTGIFHVNQANTRIGTLLQIRFDGDSTINCATDGAALIAYKLTNGTLDPDDVKLYLEDGVAINANLANNMKAIKYDAESSSYVAFDAEEAQPVIKVVSVGTDEELENWTRNDIGDGMVILSIPHTMGEAVKEKEVPPTCTDAGSYDRVVYCTDDGCGFEYYRETVTVEATGHSFIDGACSGCDETLWAPEEGSGVYYAVWSSEDSYLSDEDPDKVSYVATLDNVGEGYVRVYKNITFGTPIESQTLVLADKTLVIDLLGTQNIEFSKYVRVKKNANLVVRDGSLLHSNQIPYELNSKVTFERLNINVTTNSDFVQNCGASMVVYKDSTVTFTSDATTYACLACDNPGDSVTKFVNTKVVFNGTRTRPLFVVSQNTWGNDNREHYVFIFDKDSSVIGNLPQYIRLVESYRAGGLGIYDFETEMQKLYFEEGFTFSKNAQPTFTYGLVAIDKTEFTTLAEAFRSSDSFCDIQMVGSDLSTAITPYYVNSNTDGTFSLSSEEKIIENWAPSEITTWAAFESKEVYDNGGYPLLSSEGKLTSKSLDSLGNVYVKLFNDTTYDIEGGDQFFLNSNQSVTIELNGKKLSVAAGQNFNTAANGAKATIKFYNGDIYAPKQFQGKRTNDVYFYNVDIVTDLYFGYNDGADIFHFDGCSLTINGTFGFYLGVNTNASGSIINFIDTDLILTSSTLATDKTHPKGEERNAIFYILYNENYHSNWNITFDKDSSISCPNMETQPLWLSYIVTASNGVPKGEMPKIYIEEGFTFVEKNAAPNFNYVSRPYGATAFVDDDDPTAVPALIAVVKPGTKTAVTGNLYADKTADGYDVFSGDENVAWYVEGDVAGEFQVATKASATATAAGELATVTLDDLLALSDGATVKVMQNLWCDFARVNAKHASDLTFNLNGKTLYFASDWYVAGDKSVDNLTFVNGTVDATYSSGESTFMGDFGVLTFDNVTLKSTKNNTIAVHVYGDKLVMNNCVIDHTGAYAIGIRLSSYASQTVELNNVNITATTYGIIKQVYADTNDEYYLTNCTFTANTAFAVYGGSDTADSAVKFILKGGNVTANTMLADDVLKETGASRGVVANADVRVILSGTEASSKTVSDSDATPNLHVIEGSLQDALDVNLTLSTNFNINFYADKDIVTDVKLNGESIANGEWEGRDKYTVTVSAIEAANELTFTVETVYGTFTVNYSVLKYAEDLLASDYSSESKLLAKAAIAYVKEAYEYANKENTEYTLPEKLANFSTAGVQAQTAAGTENYTSAIAGVSLFLDEGVKIVLRLNPEYNGTVVVGGKTYNVTNGTVDSSDTIVIGYMKAKELYDGSVSITAGSETGEFTLAAFVANDTEAKALLDALYTYCYYADAYAAYVDANGGVMN